MRGALPPLLWAFQLSDRASVTSLPPALRRRPTTPRAIVLVTFIDEVWVETPTRTRRPPPRW
jgi:hypothetical protein